ncbi:MAG TPA: LysE family transporter [Gemmatimonadales bacterium]|nr:LysE family transporter [Gemmatimonadales bacterium]
MLGFVAAAIVLVLIPGPNTMIILAHSLGRGRAVGLATVAGVELGTLAHTIAAALGLSALLSASALAFAA